MSEDNINYSSDGKGVLFDKEQKLLVKACETLSGNYSMPQGLIGIEDYAFYDCEELTSIVIPEGVSSIGNYAFCGCTKMSTINIPKGLVSIGNYAFCDCEKLTSIDIPEGVTNIGHHAFYSCYMLTTVTIPESVTTIQSYVFGDCSRLAAITIPKTMIEIKDNAFFLCSRLATVFYRGAETLRGDLDEGLGNQRFRNATWHYQISDQYIDEQLVYLCGKCGLRYYPNGDGVTLRQLSISKAPNKTNYIVGERIDLSGICLEGVYLDGVTVSLGASAVKTISADLTTPGKKDVLITIQGATAEFTIDVHEGIMIELDPSVYPASSHNYENNLNETKTFTYPGCRVINITFSAQTSLENGYDYIYIYDGTGIELAQYTGTIMAGRTLTIPGDSFSIKLTSDSTGTRYGYSFESIRVDTGEMYHPEVKIPATVTCTQDGLTEGAYCEVCGRILVSQQVLEATGHSYIAEVVTQAQCGSEGVKVYTCIQCADSYSETIPATGAHNWGMWENVEDPTCEQMGSAERKCLNCSATEATFLEPSGHSLVTVPGVAATCTQAGMTEGLICEKCGEIAIMQEEIPPVGHKLDQAVCTVCGFSEQICGDNAFWKLADGVLTISGTGQMYDFKDTAQPWYNEMGEIKRILIEDGLTSIGNYAFKNCHALVDVEISNSVTNIGKHAFSNCSTLLEIVVPGSVNTIQDLAFVKCSNLENVIIENGVTAIGRQAFQGCVSITNISFPDSIQKLGATAFEDCTKLNNIAIPDGVTSIPGSLFENCKSLKNITIPDSVTRIGMDAFRNCVSLESICIPSGVSYVDLSAFTGCVCLREVQFEGNAPRSYWQAVNGLNATVYYPAKNPTWSLEDMRNCSESITLLAIDGIDVCNDADETSSYTRFSDALANCDPVAQYIKLNADMIVDISLNQNLYLDLNGYSMSGTIMTNGYQVYGMDSTTDDYACAGIGYFSCVDENGQAIVPVRQFASDITGTSKRYMAIEGENGYSFHRFFLGVTHMSVKPSVDGVGYKALFCGDEMVAGELESYGYSLWFDGYQKATGSKNADSFVSGKTVTLRINNFDAENFGEKALHAAVTMTLKDGTVIESSEYTMTLRGLVEEINENTSSLTQTQIQAIADMIKRFAVMQSWKVENLYS